jgi:septum formation protein
MDDLILASGSATRAAMLRAAGLTFTVQRPPVDEESVKASLRAEGLAPRDQADALAEIKAISVSRRCSGLVIGGDQMLAFEGQGFDKPPNRDGAREQLLRLRGKSHHLICAAVIAKDGAPIWRRIETPKLTMRNFSEAFLDSYLDAAGDDILSSVGGYQLEGLGAQLFESVEGDYFSILGLPLLAVLAFLRTHGVAQA